MSVLSDDRFELEWLQVGLLDDSPLLLGPLLVLPLRIIPASPHILATLIGAAAGLAQLIVTLGHGNYVAVLSRLKRHHCLPHLTIHVDGQVVCVSSVLCGPRQRLFLLALYEDLLEVRDAGHDRILLLLLLLLWAHPRGFRECQR